MWFICYDVCDSTRDHIKHHGAETGSSGAQGRERKKGRKGKGGGGERRWAEVAGGGRRWAKETGGERRWAGGHHHHRRVTDGFRLPQPPPPGTAVSGGTAVTASAAAAPPAAATGQCVPNAGASTPYRHPLFRPHYFISFLLFHIITTIKNNKKKGETKSVVIWSKK